MANRKAEGRYDLNQDESISLTVTSTKTICLVDGAVNSTSLPIGCNAACAIKPLFLHGPNSTNFVTLFLAFSTGAKGSAYSIAVADDTGTIDTIKVRQDPARKTPYEDSYTMTLRVV